MVTQVMKYYQLYGVQVSINLLNIVIFTSNAQHEQMAAHYISTIANGLKMFDNYQHTDSFYEAVAWEGLVSINDNNTEDPNDQINTTAWDEKTTTEQNEIKNTIIDQKENGNKNCN